MLSRHPFAVPVGTVALIFKAEALGELGIAVVAALTLIFFALLVFDREVSVRSKGPHGTSTHRLSLPRRRKRP
jgi:hypothetical protein